MAASATALAFATAVLTIARWVVCRPYETGCRTLVDSVATTARFFLDLAGRVW